MVMLDSSFKEAQSIDVAIRSSRSLHSTITEMLQKCSDLKEELLTRWQLKTAYVIPLVLSTVGIIPNKLHDSLKLLNHRPAMCIPMQTAEILSMCRIVSFYENSE
jgi:hypothetical protein